VNACSPVSLVNDKFSTRELILACACAGISQLRHPNIALFMGAYFERDHVGMLVEYMPRGTLHQLIHNPKVPLQATDVVSLWALTF